MNHLFPPIRATVAHRIDVGGGHLVHVEESGRRDGQAVVFLHGGPGSGCNSGHYRYFDSSYYRIILVDQRGCGRSTPAGGTRANSTRWLIQDLETIRRRLGIEHWLLFGGSWGATLALAYLRRHAERVSGMILRGTFLARSTDLTWFFGPDGVARTFPDAYEDLLRLIPSAERHDVVGAYHRRIHDDDVDAAFEWARAWAAWEDRVATWTLPPSNAQGVPERARLLAKVRIATHYAVNHFFLADRPLLDSVNRLPDVPVSIVHGQRDLVCPVEAARVLHQAIPGSRLILLPEAGHLAMESAMIDALVGETNRFRVSEART